MGSIALVRCVLVLRCGLAGVVWCGFLRQAEAVLQPAGFSYGLFMAMRCKSICQRILGTVGGR